MQHNTCLRILCSELILRHLFSLSGSLIPLRMSVVNGCIMFAGSLMDHDDMNIHLSEVKTEADSDDVSEHPHDGKQKPHLSTVGDEHFAVKGYLDVHERGGSSYSCTECEQHFTSEPGLRIHMNIHVRKYKCNECERSFDTDRALAIHRSRHYSREKPFACTICSKRFTQACHLKVHSRIHSGEKPYKCHVCDKAFAYSSVLQNHIRVHSGDKPYKCSLCNKSFSDLGSLQKHTLHVHSNSRPYDCSYCGKQFKGNIHLKRHVRVHTGEKPYSCEHCSECFKWSSQRSEHLLKSHDEGTWLICYICGQKFSNSGNLKRHLLQHNKSYDCDRCTRCFYTLEDLTSHRLTHADYK